MSSAIKPLFKVPGPLRPKTSLITNDYDLSQKVLGVGINGKVLECFEKKTGGRFALKVSTIIVRHATLVWLIHVEIQSSFQFCKFMNTEAIL